MHIRYPFLQSDQRGDTIVEVLIALAVISSVLAGAFFVTNHSSQNVRDTEEHAQALQLLQGQIEQLRGQATLPGARDGNFPVVFCYDSSGTLQKPASSADYTKCTTAPGGVGGAVYGFVITKQSLAGQSRLFTATVQWSALSGQTNSEQLLYRIDLQP